MKLKKTEVEAVEAAAAPAGGAVIADRFKLDAAPEKSGPAGVGKTSSLVAMIAALASVAMLGAVTALLYTNWEFLKDV